MSKYLCVSVSVNPSLQLSTIQPLAHSYLHYYQQNTEKDRREKFKKIIVQDKDGLTCDRKKPQSHQHYKATNKPKQNQPTKQVMQRHSPTPSQQMSAQSVSKKQTLWKKYTTIPPFLFFFSLLSMTLQSTEYLFGQLGATFPVVSPSNILPVPSLLVMGTKCRREVLMLWKHC